MTSTEESRGRHPLNRWTGAIIGIGIGAMTLICLALLPHWPTPIRQHSAEQLAFIGNEMGLRVQLNTPQGTITAVTRDPEVARCLSQHHQQHTSLQLSVLSKQSQQTVSLIPSLYPRDPDPAVAKDWQVTPAQVTQVGTFQIIQDTLAQQPCTLPSLYLAPTPDVYALLS